MQLQGILDNGMVAMYYLGKCEQSIEVGPSYLISTNALLKAYIFFNLCG